MFEGELIGIFVAAEKAAPLRAVESVEARAGEGLVGDRYFLQKGTFTKPGQVDREVTLIESEALDALARETEVALEPAAARRNLLTRGVPLNHLVGQEFVIGETVLRGIRLCEPCGHLEGLTGKGVKSGLIHRGGLRAQILKGGLLCTGDRISQRSHQHS